MRYQVVAIESGGLEDFKLKFHTGTRVFGLICTRSMAKALSNFVSFFFLLILATISSNRNAMRYDNRRHKDQNDLELHEFYASPGKPEQRPKTLT